MSRPFSTPLLRWYLVHGIVVDRVYQFVEYEPNPCFQRFGGSVSAARCAGDSDPEKAIIADTIKLLGNSGYGKTVTNVDRHPDVKYEWRGNGFIGLCSKTYYCFGATDKYSTKVSGKTSSTKTPFSPCSRIARVVVGSIGASACVIRP